MALIVGDVVGASGVFMERLNRVFGAGSFHAVCPRRVPGGGGRE